MAKLRENLIAKIVAVILAYITVLSFVFSAVFTGVMGYYKFYFSNEPTVEKEILTDMAKSEIYYIDSLMHRGTDLNGYYADKNVYFVVTNTITGDVIASNYSGEEYIVSASEEMLFSQWFSYEADVEFNEKSDKITYFDDGFEIRTSYNIELYVAKKMTKNDLFSVVSKIVKIGYNLRYSMVAIMLISLILAIAVHCFLFCSAGHKDGEIKLNAIDKLPFDVYTAFIIAAAVCSVIGVDAAYNLASRVLFIFVIGTIDYFLGLGYTMSFATRMKIGGLLKNTLILHLLKIFWKATKKGFKMFKYLISCLPTIKKTIIGLIVLLTLEFFAVVFVLNTYWAHDWGFLLFGLIAVNILAVLAVLYLAFTLQKIKVGGEKIASGDLEYKIDTTNMFGDFKDFSQSLNNINHGLQTAIEEKMKSERFKTELITNVSHDIKTPITSIINYVDLLKKEDIESENAKEYIEVLDRQSGKLKKLVEDLVEASKASTGNLSVNLEVLDVSVLLSQTLGEFEDKLKSEKLIPVLRAEKENVKILADGKHLWRVFENLMSNICKYAQNGTRVYLDIASKNGKAVITFRNISKYQLNDDAELCERFVRGDSSRNTEGSGLGLSIAKSLVELQNGKLEIFVDGDLFKVRIEFKEI